MVTCTVSDDCDPAPAVGGELLVSHVDVPSAGTCAPRADEVAVACGEVVYVELLPPLCPARAHRPRSSLRIRADGVKVVVVVGERVLLQVSATDAAGNSRTVEFDPAVAPSPLCDLRLVDGTCCPALTRPRAGRCGVPLCADAPGPGSSRERTAAGRGSRERR